MKSCRTLQLVLAALLTTPLAATASSWSCSQGNNVREVHIERPEGAWVPCEVVYRKLTEGVEDQVLWNAQHDDSYCDEQATAFIAKLESGGWVCRETIRDKESEAKTGEYTTGAEEMSE